MGEVFGLLGMFLVSCIKSGVFAQHSPALAGVFTCSVFLVCSSFMAVYVTDGPQCNLHHVSPPAC